MSAGLRTRMAAAAGVAIPMAAVLLFLAGWEAAVRHWAIPAYLLPAPSRIASTLWAERAGLLPSWWITLRITLSALGLAVVSGVGLASLFALSRTAERALSPFTVVLQVTPVIAVAPLIMIVTDDPPLTVLLCAWIVAFFPVVANTLTGLRSVDPHLRDLFRLHRASRWQTLRWLLVPGALPHFFSGLKVAGGLALIGAVVGEFTAGAAGRDTGLASRILEAMFRTEIPKMFAALSLVLATGVGLHAALGALSRAVLGRWHASERDGPAGPAGAMGPGR